MKFIEVESMYMEDEGKRVKVNLERVDRVSYRGGMVEVYVMERVYKVEEGKFLSFLAGEEKMDEW